MGLAGRTAVYRILTSGRQSECITSSSPPYQTRRPTDLAQADGSLQPTDLPDRAWTPSLQSNLLLSLPRPHRVVQLEQQILHIRSLTCIGMPGTLNDFPQTPRETTDPRSLWHLWPMTIRNSCRNRNPALNIPERNIPRKDLTKSKSNHCEDEGTTNRTDLVYNHPEGVTVGLFGRPTIASSKLIWDQ